MSIFRLWAGDRTWPCANTFASAALCAALACPSTVSAQTSSPGYQRLLAMPELQTTAAWKAEVGVPGLAQPPADLAIIGATCQVVGYAFDEVAAGNLRGGDARSLSGLDSAMVIPAQIMNDRISGGDWSMITWCRRNTAGQPTTVEAMGTGAVGHGSIWISPCTAAFYNLDLNRASVIFANSTSAGVSHIHSGVLLNGMWHMLGFTFESSTRTLSIVVNGKKTSSVVLPPTAVPGPIPRDMHLGAYNENAPTRAMPWTFDYTSIHAKALSAQDIAAMYNVYLGFSGVVDGGVVSRPLYNPPVLTEMSRRAMSHKVVVLGVGDSQMVRNTSGSGIPIADTDQGFILTEALMLRTLDRGRPLQGFLGAPIGPDASNSYVLGYACWNNSGHIGPVPPAPIAERSIWHMNEALNHDGFRFGVYSLPASQTLSGGGALWHFDPAEDRWGLARPFTPRVRLNVHTQVLSPGAAPGIITPVLYRVSDQAPIAGGLPVTVSSDQLSGSETLTLDFAGTEPQDTKLAFSLARSTAGFTTAQGPVAVGACLLENTAQPSGFVSGVLWAWGGRGIWEANDAFARVGSSRDAVLRNGFGDMLALVEPDPVQRSLVLWIHQGGNDRNPRYSDKPAFTESFEPSPFMSNTPDGFKQNVRTFIRTVRDALAPSIVPADRLYFILGPYQDIDEHPATLLQRACRELADEDPSICHIYGPHLVPRSELAIGVSLFDWTHLNELGFEMYANAGSAAIQPYVVPAPSAPVARAGADRVVLVGDPVALDGSASSDADGTIIAAEWQQIDGPSVTLIDDAPPSIFRRVFVSPPVVQPTDLVFRLSVTDDAGNTSTDDVTIRVEPCQTVVFDSVPASASLCPGSASTLTVAATSTATPAYQWLIEAAPGTGVFEPLIDGTLLLSTGLPELVVQGSQSGSLVLRVGEPTLTPVAFRVRARASIGCAQALSPPIDVAFCPVDFNCGGSVELTDIFAYLNAWFAGRPEADVDGQGLSLTDIFAFLNAWFAAGAGC